jgi:protein Tex
VSGLGPKTFEQCAGFLRIRGGDNPLDMTGVHPESYPVVQQILKHSGQAIESLMGRADMLASLRPELFANDSVGVITVRDILKEMEKPGRDPRPAFAVARFNEGVETVADLKPGMVLEGTVSNVAAFGAFVDLGVHQDGLIHVSQLSHKFISDAREVVKTGEIVKVKVLEVDLQRQRVSLTMKLDASPAARSDSGGQHRPKGAGNGQHSQHDRSTQPVAASAMASAFAKLQKSKG